MNNTIKIDHVEITKGQLAHIVATIKNVASNFDDTAVELEQRESGAASTYYDVCDVMRAFAAALYAQHQPARTDDHKRTITITITNE